jgi:hypothetical protein
MISQTNREKVLQHVNRDEVAQLTKELVDISSPDRIGKTDWGV